MSTEDPNVVNTDGYSVSQVVLRDTPTLNKRYKNYECNSCKYSTIYLDLMRGHIQKGIHVWGGKPAAEIPTVDATEEPKF